MIDDDIETEAAEGERDARPWLQLLRDAEQAERYYHDCADRIEEVFANLKRMAGGDCDRQFRMFWANVEVQGPTIYARPPQPVVAPMFKDRAPLPRRAADLLERALRADVQTDELHDDLCHLRDDLVLASRGAGWVRLLEDGRGLRAAFEHLHRRDFRHEPARKWKEVSWVARRAFLTREEMRQRFGEDLPRGIEFKEHKLGRDDGEGDAREQRKAEVWEIWHKPKRMVVWVAMGCDETLDQRPPLYDLPGFFPCPRPVFGTIEPGTLRPVPDYYQARDQLEEINILTAKIHALSEALRLKGFYAAGTSDLGSAVEVALSDDDDRATLVPVENMGGLGPGGMRDAVVWMPLTDVATAIQGAVQLRQQLIRDVYEITGLSDIMRGETNASETATAQRLKAEFGSIRVRKRQEEMARFSRDVIRLKAELMAEQFPIEVLLEMSQVTDLPRAQQVQAQVAQQVQRQVVPQLMQRGAHPVQIQQQLPQIIQQGVQRAMQKTVTVEQVEQLLRDQRLRPFVLEIETDSTIQINESAEKASRAEFLQVFGGFMREALPLVQQAPQAADLVAEALRFVANAYRVDRSMDDAIDAFAESIKRPQQGAGQQAEQQKAQAEQMRAKVDAQKAQAEAQADQMRARGDMARAQADVQRTAAETRKVQAETAQIMAQPMGVANGY